MLVADVVIFLDEYLLRLLPLIQVVNLAISWKKLIRLSELLFIARYLRVDVDDSRYLELDIEHLALFG